MQSRRNIGIIAHIDAGKTTLSERILFYTKKIHRMGEVHDGTATMDFLPEEQERGITIASACTSCTWNDSLFNLIDTPGHVDFTIEVERSLRILDGAVGVFCAVGGVEPQTETVWRQSEKFHVPKLAFVNKEDRIGANFAEVFQNIETRLNALPVPVTIPLGEGDDFRGILDVLRIKTLIFNPEDEGRTWTEQEPSPTEAEQIYPWRERLLERLAEQDEIFIDQYLSGNFIEEDIRTALRRATCSRRLTPVFCGSALKNIGIQPLLNGIEDFLPSPEDCSEVEAHAKNETPVRIFCRSDDPAMGLIFKILIEDGQKLAFMRLYAGSLSEGQLCWNASEHCSERITRLFRMHADRREPLKTASAGDIVAVIGFKKAKTGDTIADQETDCLLETISGDAPVISLALEPRNADEGKILDEALKRFADEDPTFTISEDEGSGHRIISGMGELHLDVILERIRREYHISPRCGLPQVIRRETPCISVSEHTVFEKELGKEQHIGEIVLTVSPAQRGSGNAVSFSPDLHNLPSALQEAVLQGIENALQCGPVTGYPLQDTQVIVTDLPLRSGGTPVGYHMAAGTAVRSALQKAGTRTLEPIMLVEINVPENAMGAAISLFGSRGGKVENIVDRSGLKAVVGLAPLSTLFGFSTDLRSATQGRAGLSLRFQRFDALE
ncbi:MAG: elongation factor G [Desulfovibrionaceae bacterium]|nr:elongation factor G [Desulfovibrionaceae bacterium]